MTKINSKQKGGRFEREVAKKFQEWTGVEFHRTPGSGSFSTRTKMDEMAGDLVCLNPHFRYSLELKKREGWHLEHLLSNQKTPILDWWKQTVNQCPVDKEPLLIFSKNRTPIYCMTNNFPPGGNRLFNYFEFKTFDEKENNLLTLYIFELNELLKLNPENYFDERFN